MTVSEHFFNNYLPNMAIEFRRLYHVFPSTTLAVSLLFVLAACSSTPGINSSGPIETRDVLRLVSERNSAITAVEGYGTISIDSPEMSNSASISVKMLRPDSLQLDINGPFGVTVVRSLVTRNSFIFYDGFNNTVAEGPTTSDNLRKVLRVGLEFEDILDIVSGAIRLPDESLGLPEGFRDNDNYMLTWKGDTGSREYTVDLRYRAVRRYIRRDKTGDIMEEVNYKDFRKRGQHHLPQVMSISRPASEESLSLVFQNQTVNDFPVQFSFSAPRSAKRVYF
jgi:outer membrane biogenesis lipoprotein LolB